MYFITFVQTKLAHSYFRKSTWTQLNSDFHRKFHSTFNDLYLSSNLSLITLNVNLILIRTSTKLMTKSIPVSITSRC